MIITFINYKLRVIVPKLKGDIRIFIRIFMGIEAVDLKDIGVAAILIINLGHII